jgi:hypothetical protein
MKHLAIVPGSSALDKNEIFNLKSKYNFDNRLKPYFLLKKKFKKIGIEINTLDIYNDYSKIDLVLFQTLRWKCLDQCFSHGLEDKLIYIAVEPPVVEKNNTKKNLKKLEKSFRYILTWRDDLIDNKKYFKYFFPQEFEKPVFIEHKFNDKKLLTNISGMKFSKHPKELYSNRLKMIKYFEKNHSEEFDFYGKGWVKSKKKYKNYKGEVESKFETYQNYKFALCFENMKEINGYVTEKIFDCFVAGIIPIYWGASNIEEYIPKTCFIDYREFENIEDLYDYISNMSKREYINYINSIQKYLNSKEVDKFRTNNFIEIILNLLKKHEKDKIEFNTSVSFKCKTKFKSLMGKFKLKIKEYFYND